VFKNSETIPGKNKSLRLTRLKSRRQIWLCVHLWLGLVLGLFLSIFGITGSILVFHAEIDELLNPTLLTIAQPVGNPDYKSLSDIFQAGILSIPKGSLEFADYPRNSEAVFKLSFTEELATDQTQSWEVYVDPYRANVIGKRLISDSNSLFPKTFINFIFKLHYALLIKSHDVSTVVVGLSSALLIISVLTGLIVWWPLTGRWYQALTVKPKSGSVRFNYDLHKVTGFYASLVILPVLFSGIYMVLPHNVVPVLELFSPVTYRYWFQSTPTPDAEPITMAQAVAIADNRYPTGRPDWIYGATTTDSTYTVCKNGVEESGSNLQRRCVVMDRYSGKILDVDDPAIGTAGEAFTQWQWPLHSGQAFGWTGRLLVFLTGLACPVLFVTGVIRWLQKRKAAQKVRRAALSKSM
jgi:uncharacterized iron-regulated membrane protein